MAKKKKAVRRKKAAPKSVGLSTSEVRACGDTRESRELTSRGAQLTEVFAEAIGLRLDNDRLRREDLLRRASLRYAAVASDLLAQSLDMELTSALIPRPKPGMPRRPVNAHIPAPPINKCAMAVTLIVQAVGKNKLNQFNG